MSAATALTVLRHDDACDDWLRESRQWHIIDGTRPETTPNDGILFVLTTASRLPAVTELVRGANRRHRLGGLFVRADVDPAWLGQLLDRARLRALRRLLVHRDGAQPRRVLSAWSVGAQEELIADALALDDRLLVVSCALQRVEVPWTALAKQSRLAPANWGPFQVADDGSYLHWPKPDIHLDLPALRQTVDPRARDEARAERLRSQQDFGDAVAARRKGAGLRQTDIEGVTARQIRRIESGEVFPRLTTLSKLAAAHGLSTAQYLDALARELR